MTTYYCSPFTIYIYITDLQTRYGRSRTYTSYSEKRFPHSLTHTHTSIRTTTRVSDIYRYRCRAVGERGHSHHSVSFSPLSLSLSPPIHIHWDTQLLYILHIIIYYLGTWLPGPSRSPIRTWLPASRCPGIYIILLYKCRVAPYSVLYSWCIGRSAHIIWLIMFLLNLKIHLVRRLRLWWSRWS